MQPTPYQRDILDQPRALHETLRGLREQTFPAEISNRVRSGGFRRVVLTGMGSSYFAFHPLHQALVRRGVEAVMVETSELLYSLPGLLEPGSLVIAASQSGSSAETISLTAQKRRGFTLVGVTNTPGSPLAELADARVLTRAGEEETVSCKTYLAGLAALAWLEPALAGEQAGPVLEALDEGGRAVETYLASWQEHVAWLMERLRPVRDLFLVGRGESLAAVGTGGLIVKESTHLHGEGMSSAAFRHGPMELLAPDVFVLVFEGQGEAAGLNRRLFADIQAEGSGAGLVSESAAEAVFRLPRVMLAARPLLEILPVQMMTLALAELRGHQAGKFTRATKVTTVE